MRINLNAAEFAAVRNALARRNEDLLDLIAEWSQDERMAESEAQANAEEERDVILALDEKLVELARR